MGNIEDASMGLRHLLLMARKNRGWTESEAATHFGISQPSYHKWESGENSPGRKNIAKVAQFLGIAEADVWQLKYEMDQPTTPGATRAIVTGFKARLDATDAQVEKLEAEVYRLSALVERFIRQGVHPGFVSDAPTPKRPPAPLEN